MILKYLFLVLYSPLILIYFKKKYSPLQIYQNLENKIYGKEVFNILIGFTSPYSYSINPLIQKFNDDECIISINQSYNLKNPFNSIHAVALTNLGELTSGLLMMENLKKHNQKGIITQIKSEYFKKARKKITAISNLKNIKEDCIKTELFDQDNNLVCNTFCLWTIKKDISKEKED